MTPYDIECTFAEMVANGHTKFHFRFELRDDTGVSTFEDFYYLADAQDIVSEMELILYVDDIAQHWVPVGLE